MTMKFGALVEKLAASAIYQLLATLVGAAFVSTVGASVIPSLNPVLKDVLIAITILSLSAALAISYKFYMKYKYTIINQEVFLELYEGITPRLVKDVTAKARISGIDSIRNFTVAKSKNVSHSLISCDRGIELRRVPSSGVEDTYHVVFSRPLRRGDVINYRVRTENTEMEKFLCMEIVCPTKKMQLAVYTQSDYKTARIRVYKNYPDQFNLLKDIKVSNYVVWNIKNPKVGYNYQIEWD